jgi:hypothetical protein
VSARPQSTSRHLTKVLEDLFEAVAAMFPAFDPCSALEAGGITQLSMTMTMEVVEVPAPSGTGGGEQQEVK